MRISDWSSDVCSSDLHSSFRLLTPSLNHSRHRKSMGPDPTDGYYLTGANTRAMGMGGVGIALPQGPEAATINPAGASFVESGFEIGTQVFILKTRTTDLFFPGNDVSGHQYQQIGRAHV